MTKGGIIIRLIDVAMIILFGFIAISDIKVRAQIKLPADDQEQTLPEEEMDPALIFVKIDLEYGFVIERKDETLLTTTDINGLEKGLVQLLNRYKTIGQEMVVLIEPHEDSMIQHTVDVLDICEKHSIPKNINYESMQF